jgi:hypothetical protein
MNFETDKISTHIFFSNYVYYSFGNSGFNIFDEKYKFIFNQHGEFKTIEISIRNKQRKYIVFENGVIFSKHDYKDSSVNIWGKVFNNKDRNEEFVYNGKWINRAKFILHAFKNYDWEEKENNVEFIDGDKTNYNIKNLRVV